MVGRNGGERGKSVHGPLAAPLRRALVVAVSLIVLQLAVAASAQAENFFYYGKNNATCFQTGSPGASNEECRSVGAGYLPGHMKGGAIGADVQLINEGVTGDYCNYANITEGLNTANSNNQSSYTGFTPASPLGSYQEGNHQNLPDVCQAWGATWGQVLRGRAGNGNCTGQTTPCNMEHFAALGAQGNNDRPWAAAFISPSLVVSAEADPQKVEAPNSWGFLCPLLRDSSRGAIIEYCLEQWHVGSGSFPAYHHFDEAGPCNFGGGQVFTGFAPGTRFAEKVSGSAETFEFRSNPAPRQFSARITAANLIAAVEAIEAHGCGALSHNPADYALVGIEQGVEGGGMSLIGGHTANLQASTDFSGYRAPQATTTSPGAVTETEATLNGSLTPNGTDTHYYFEYGRSTAYGATTSNEDAGSGFGSQGVHASLANLAPGMTYHYRLTASNAGGVVHGADQTVTTYSPPALAIDSLGERWYTVQGPNNSLQMYWESTNGEVHGPRELAKAGTTYSQPALAIDKENQRWYTVQGPNNSLQMYWESTNGEVHGPRELAKAGTTYSAPVLAVDGLGERWYTVQGPNNSLQMYWESTNGEVHGPRELAKAGTTYSQPALAIDKENQRWYTVQGPNNSLQMYWESTNGEVHGPRELAKAGTTYSAPVLAVDSLGQRWYTVQGPNNSLQMYWESTNGEVHGPRELAKAGTTYSRPSLALDKENQRWYSIEGPNNSLQMYWESTGGEVHGPRELAKAGTTYSVAPLAIDGLGQRWYSTVGISNSLDMYWESTNGEVHGPRELAKAGTSW